MSKKLPPKAQSLAPSFPQDYAWHTKPFGHQEAEFHTTRDLDVWARFWQMGTGKSKVTIDEIAWQFIQGRLLAVVIVAPKGVHRNWANLEIPIHLPSYIPVKLECWPKASEETLIKPTFHGLRILCINYDAISRPAGRSLAQKLLMSFPSGMILDEGHRIKTPSSGRAKACIALSRWPRFKRVLTGTPITKKPFDLYNQFRFLDWTIFGDSFAAFKGRYALWCERYEAGQEPEHMLTCEKKYNALLQRLPENAQKFFEMQLEDEDGRPVYQNMDELIEILEKNSSRVLKSECMDLPPKMFIRREVELTPEQKKFYKLVQTKILSEFEQDDQSLPKTVLVDMAIKRMLRLHQIAGGFVRYEEDDQPVAIPGGNPKLQDLLSLIDGYEDEKWIIWCHFTAEVKLVAATLKELYGEETVVEYHGGIKSDKARDLAVDRFQDQERIYEPGNPIPKVVPRASKVKFFVGQEQSGGIGITLNKAHYMYYFSNGFSYENRAQSEDRGHRGTMDHHLTIHDSVALGTIDEKVLATLQHNQDIADLVTGDGIKMMEKVLGEAKKGKAPTVVVSEDLSLGDLVKQATTQERKVVEKEVAAVITVAPSFMQFK